jgi:hypothetical protein
VEGRSPQKSVYALWGIVKFHGRLGESDTRQIALRIYK